MSLDTKTALDTLREILPTGSIVRTILRHKSASGMSRSISAVFIAKDGTVGELDYPIVRAGLGKFDSIHGGIKMGGCGMDMGFSLVYGLSRALYPTGHPCTGHDRKGPRGAVRCPSNDHSNGDRIYRRGKMHADGGYALNQAWL